MWYPGWNFTLYLRFGGYSVWNYFVPKDIVHSEGTSIQWTIWDQPAVLLQSLDRTCCTRSSELRDFGILKASASLDIPAQQPSPTSRTTFLVASRVHLFA